MTSVTRSDKLDRQALFEIVCQEVLSDGVLESSEAEILKSLQKLLQLPPETAKEILSRVREGAASVRDESAQSIDPEATFRRACELAWQDGSVEREEVQLLSGLAAVLELDRKRARAMIDEAGQAAVGSLEPPSPPARVDTAAGQREPSDVPDCHPADSGPGRQAPAVEVAPEVAVPMPPARPRRQPTRRGPAGPGSIPVPGAGGLSPSGLPVPVRPRRQLVAGGTLLIIVAAGGLWSAFLRGEDPVAAPAAREETRMKAEGASAREFTREELKAMTVDGFLALSPADRLSAMIAHVRATEDPAFGSETVLALVTRASAAGRLAAFRTAWIELLRGRDPRMMTETYDTMTLFTAEGMKEERVNHRTDDTWFKEQVLYLVRDNTEADSPDLDELFQIFEAEKDAMTRMRIVRAIGTIGGPRSRPLLQKVVDRESERNTHAAQEAEKWLSGASSGPLGMNLFTPPKEAVPDE